MSRIDLVLAFLVPALRTAAILLATKDANVTGADDNAARAINLALDALEKYQAERLVSLPEKS
jgi:hypothetical protein